MSATPGEAERFRDPLLRLLARPDPFTVDADGRARLLHMLQGGGCSRLTKL